MADMKEVLNFWNVDEYNFNRCSRNTSLKLKIDPTSIGSIILNSTKIDIFFKENEKILKKKFPYIGIKDALGHSIGMVFTNNKCKVTLWIGSQENSELSRLIYSLMDKYGTIQNIEKKLKTYGSLRVEVYMKKSEALKILEECLKFKGTVPVNFGWTYAGAPLSKNNSRMMIANREVTLYDYY